MELRRIRTEEAEQLWQMQKTCFAALLETYQDYETNPAAEPLSRITARLMQPFTYYYWITDGGVTAGAIRIVEKQDGSRRQISPLFILPEHRRKGLALAAIEAAEHLHGAENWALSTILQEPGNCRLYEKAGYHQTGETLQINENMTLVFYEKN
ncbi:MAG TPA: N-acetyltransferase [Ruminococcus sp.]|nr:N-acetyltransferase [Ruminococcus sp.]